MPNSKKPRPKCPICGKEPYRSSYKYCSNVCQMEYQYQSYVAKWKMGKESGLMCLGLVSQHVKKYLRRKFENKCCLCGWSRVNIKTGKIPLVADHVDGDWQNNVENNFRLICPNCDSLTPTYAGSNKGNGRNNRAPSKRAKEGRLLIQKTPE